MSQSIDPQYSSKERAELIQGYNALKSKIQANAEQLINSQSPQKLTEMIITQDELFKKINTASTLTHDCQTLFQIADIAVDQVSSVNLGPRSMTLSNVKNQIMVKYPRNNFVDWEAFGEYALRHSKVAPKLSHSFYGLGEFQNVHHQRKQPARSQKDTIAELQSVGNKELSESRANQLLAKAKLLCDKLRQEGETPLSTIITNSSSFADTVENAFEFAHLVREGKVGIHQKGASIVAEVADQRFDAGSMRKQCVLHLRQADYKKVIEKISSQ